MAKENKRGRKSKYNTHVEPYLDRLPKWRRQGLTEAQICKRLDVGVSTWERYKNDYKELREALKEGKEELIEELETSLYKKALGYEYNEYKYENKDGVITETKLIKHLAPDTGALAFSLKNLDPERWKDRHNLEHGGGVSHRLEPEVAERIKDDPKLQDTLKELYRSGK